MWNIKCPKIIYSVSLNITLGDWDKYAVKILYIYEHSLLVYLND